MNKGEFLEVFQQMLVSAFEMNAAAQVGDGESVGEAAIRLHNLGGRLSPNAMEVVVGVLISQWAVYVSKDDDFMHPEEAIDFMINKLDGVLK